MSLNKRDYVYYPTAGCAYYMDDLEQTLPYPHSFPGAAVLQREGRATSISSLDEKALLEEYGIELVKWSPSEPIKNYDKPE